MEERPDRNWDEEGESPRGMRQDWLYLKENCLPTCFLSWYSQFVAESSVVFYPWRNRDCKNASKLQIKKGRRSLIQTYKALEVHCVFSNFLSLNQDYISVENLLWRSWPEIVPSLLTSASLSCHFYSALSEFYLKRSKAVPS